MSVFNISQTITNDMAVAAVSSVSYVGGNEKRQVVWHWCEFTILHSVPVSTRWLAIMN